MFDETDDLKRRQAEQLVRRSIEAGTGCISYQVVQETLNVATRRLGFAADDACALLADVLVPLWTIHPSRELSATSRLATPGNESETGIDARIMSHYCDS